MFVSNVWDTFYRENDDKWIRQPKILFVINNVIQIGEIIYMKTDDFGDIIIVVKIEVLCRLENNNMLIRWSKWNVREF